MNYEFAAKFEKDLLRVPKSVRKRVSWMVNLVEEVDTLEEILKVEKLKGFSNPYRIRLGDYRVGLPLINQVVIFSRIIHRKDIYKKFP